MQRCLRCDLSFDISNCTSKVDASLCTKGLPWQDYSISQSRLVCKDFIEAVTGNYYNKDASGIYDAYMLLTPEIECYSVNSIYL